MSIINDFLAGNPWSIYVIAFVGPFVQEDVAILGAAMTAAAGKSSTPGVLLATWIGVIVSDGWKYAAGRLAHRIPWAARLAARPAVIAARQKVLTRVGIALVIARFVPGTRIPLNVACGLFRVPVMRYLPFMAFSAALYIGIAWAIFEMLGKVAGEQVRAAMPFVVIPIVLAMVLIAVIRARKKNPKVVVDDPQRLVETVTAPPPPDKAESGNVR